MGLTSVDGHHINEIHVNIPADPPVSYVLQLGLLPGGTTEDYSVHIMDCINDVALIYADFRILDLMHVKCTIIKHLKNVLTDRVAVNHCVAEYLKSKLDM